MNPDCLDNGCRHDWLTAQVRDLEQNVRGLAEANGLLRRQLAAATKQVTETVRQLQHERAQRTAEWELLEHRARESEAQVAVLAEQKQSWTDQLAALAAAWRDR